MKTNLQRCRHGKWRHCPSISRVSMYPWSRVHFDMFFNNNLCLDPFFRIRCQNCYCNCNAVNFYITKRVVRLAVYGYPALSLFANLPNWLISEFVELLGQTPIHNRNTIIMTAVAESIWWNRQLAHHICFSATTCWVDVTRTSLIISSLHKSNEHLTKTYVYANVRYSYLSTYWRTDF